MRNFMLLLFAVAPVWANATVWRVNNNSNYNQWSGQQVFNNLQQAINSNLVVSGDTIYVEPSAEIYDQVEVVNKVLHFIGAGYFLDLNGGLQQNIQTSKVEQITFGVGSGGSSVDGIQFTDTPYGITIANAALSNFVITNCYVEHNIRFNNNASNLISNVLVQNCRVQDFIIGTFGVVTGLIATNNIFNTLSMEDQVSAEISNSSILGGVDVFGQAFYNNICLGTSSSTLDQNNNTATNIHHNLFVSSQPAWFTGNTNNTFGLTTAYMFVNLANPSLDARYQLKPANQCAECYQATPTGTQMGIFGGSDPYHLSGIPPIPSIYLLQHGTSVAPGGDLQITISTRSNN